MLRFHQGKVFGLHTDASPQQGGYADDQFEKGMQLFLSLAG